MRNRSPRTDRARGRAWRLLTSLAALAMASASPAQSMSDRPDARCTLPEVLLAWSRPPASIATVTERRAADVAAQVDRPYRLSLSACASPWCKPGSHAAMVKVHVPQPGRWRVALDTMMWIDVWTADARQDGVLCEHHGCLPLRKIVQYDLAAGPHWVVVEGRHPGESHLLLTRVRD